MSVRQIENLREVFEDNAIYMKGTYEAYTGLIEGTCKLSDFFQGLKAGGISYHEEHTRNSDRTYRAVNEERTLEVSVFCTHLTYPPFSLVATTYSGGFKSKQEHILETTDIDALIGYLYFIISTVDSERGKWIKI